jgi:hypothetical protein
MVDRFLSGCPAPAGPGTGRGQVLGAPVVVGAMNRKMFHLAFEG